MIARQRALGTPLRCGATPCRVFCAQHCLTKCWRAGCRKAPDHFAACRVPVQTKGVRGLTPLGSPDCRDGPPTLARSGSRSGGWVGAYSRPPSGSRLGVAAVMDSARPGKDAWRDDRLSACAGDSAALRTQPLHCSKRQIGRYSPTTPLSVGTNAVPITFPAASNGRTCTWFVASITNSDGLVVFLPPLRNSTEPDTVGV